MHEHALMKMVYSLKFTIMLNDIIISLSEM